MIWGEFLERYAKLIHDVARRSGLRSDEADEVVQDTAVSVARKMPSFVYEPGECSFEGWVRRMARLRVLDQLRKRPVEDADKPIERDSDSGTGQTGTTLRIPAGDDEQARGAMFDEAWQRGILESALARLRARVSVEHFQIFQLNVVDDRPGTEVAAMLDVSVAKVYVVRHRLTRLLKDEVVRVRRSLDEAISS